MKGAVVSRARAPAPALSSFPGGDGGVAGGRWSRVAGTVLSAQDPRDGLLPRRRTLRRPLFFTEGRRRWRAGGVARGRRGRAVVAGLEWAEGLRSGSVVVAVVVAGRARVPEERAPDCGGDGGERGPGPAGDPRPAPPSRREMRVEVGGPGFPTNPGEYGPSRDRKSGIPAQKLV